MYVVGYLATSRKDRFFVRHLVHFSIRRIGVKRFSSRFVRRQISFAIPRFSSGSVLRPSHHGIRRMKRCNLTHVLVAKAIGTRAQGALTPSIVPQRTSIHRQAELYRFRFGTEIVYAGKAALSLVHRNGVPSLHMRCMTTAGNAPGQRWPFGAPVAWRCSPPRPRRERRFRTDELAFIQ
jgi:hypothetical protein